MLGVAGDGDAGVLRAGDLHGGVLGQLGDHGVGVGVWPAVQFLHDFGNAKVGGLHLAGSFTGVTQSFCSDKLLKANAGVRRRKHGRPTA